MIKILRGRGITIFNRKIRETGEAVSGEKQIHMFIEELLQGNFVRYFSLSQQASSYYSH